MIRVYLDGHRLVTDVGHGLALVTILCQRRLVSVWWLGDRLLGHVPTGLA